MKAELPAYLTYHDYYHTIDVLEMSTQIAKEEGINEEPELIILKTAALYHDSGFLTTYNMHEAESCTIARSILPSFSYAEDQIEKICSLIQATIIPQAPNTHLEKILADADLDYLGRDDFYTIAESLFKELRHKGIVFNELEWDQIQVKFLKQHHYFTPTSIEKRKSSKEKHLNELVLKISNA